MNEEKLNGADAVGATLKAGGAVGEGMEAHGVYTAECYDSEGRLKWSSRSDNIVTYQGKSLLLSTLCSGSGYTASWYMSLITAGTATTASTYASPTVTEVTPSIIAARLATTFGTPASGAVNANTVSFSIIGSATITGAMLVTGGSGVTTVGNTAASGGVLFSASNFTGSSKAVSSGDTLNISYQLSV